MENTSNQRLKDLRLARGFSQEDFAKKIGISLSGYQLMEQGKRDISTKMLAAIKKEFEISSDWILYGENPEMDTEAIFEFALLLDTSNRRNLEAIWCIYVFLRDSDKQEHIKIYNALIRDEFLDRYNIVAQLDGSKLKLLEIIMKHTHSLKQPLNEIPETINHFMDLCEDVHDKLQDLSVDYSDLLYDNLTQSARAAIEHITYKIEKDQNKGNV